MKKYIEEALKLYDKGITSRMAIAKILHEKYGEGKSPDTFRKQISRVMAKHREAGRAGRISNDHEPGKLSSNVKSKTSTGDYKEKFVLSAWNNQSGKMMDIDSYCDYYSLPRKDITSYKLVSHTGTPYYNIVFKENISKEVEAFDFDLILSKHTKNVIPISITYVDNKNHTKDFDTLTYTDVHIGMDTDSTNNSMYAVLWNREEVIKAADHMVDVTIMERESDTLIIDELGDFLDGFDGYTTRGGHKLPQNMTNEEAFDCALEFKILVMDGLIKHYRKIIFNNICNDNHAGAFGYFVNKAFKEIAELKYGNVEVNNHRQFMNHYFMGDTCYVITHGKDDSTLKFGFKPALDSKGIEKIDQYCKQNNIYRNCTNVVFKKGDSHQALFDMATSDDFFYFNYPALSPSSQWVQNNFKKGRRGFVNESSINGRIYIKPFFI